MSYLEEIQKILPELTEESLIRVLGSARRQYNIQKRSLRTSQQHNLFPIQDEFLYNMYKEQQSKYWTAEEMDFLTDQQQFRNLPPRIQEIFCYIFGFFAPADGVISTNVDRFVEEAETYEESFFFKIQNFIESVHAEAYSLAIVSILNDEEKKKEVFSMIDQLECIQRKTDFMKKYIDSDLSKGLRCIASASMEGIFFMGIFAIIFYFRKHNYLPGFIFLNELVRRDESIHRDAFAGMAKTLLSVEEHKKAQEIVQEAVEIETQFIEFLLKEPIESQKVDEIERITPKHLKIYLQMLGDQILSLSGIDKIYHEEIYLDYIDNTSVKTNFYEKKVSQYSASAPRDKNPKKKNKLKTF